MTCSVRFSLYIQEKEEMELRPVFTEDGITFVYIKAYNTLYVQIAVFTFVVNSCSVIMFCYWR
jgi:hypothetical protein